MAIDWRIDWQQKGGIARGEGTRGLVEVFWDSQAPIGFEGYAYRDGVDSGPLEGTNLEAAMADYESMFPYTQIDRLRTAAKEVAGLAFDSAEAIELVDMDWHQHYPEADAWGNMTGQVIDADDDNYIVVEDEEGLEVMVEKWSLDKAELAKLRAGHFPVRD